MMMPDSKTRLVLIDDHPLIRKGVRLMLADYPDFEVVGEAGSADDGLALVARLKPDIVLMDINLSHPTQGGSLATRAIVERFPTVQVVILSMVDDEAEIREAIEAGAVGYLLKDIDAAELVRALETVRHGGSALSPRISRKVLAQMTGLLSGRPEARASHGLLSEKEREVLGLICQGLSNREIGERIFITEKTVKSHITAILRKLGVKDRTQAVIYAVQHKMIAV
jgi:two-component system, NarL family, response regulator DegU